VRAELQLASASAVASCCARFTALVVVASVPTLFAAVGAGAVVRTVVVAVVAGLVVAVRRGAFVAGAGAGALASVASDAGVGGGVVSAVDATTAATAVDVGALVTAIVVAPRVDVGSVRTVPAALVPLTDGTDACFLLLVSRNSAHDATVPAANNSGTSRIAHVANERRPAATGGSDSGKRGGPGGVAGGRVNELGLPLGLVPAIDGPTPFADPLAIGGVPAAPARLAVLVTGALAAAPAWLAVPAIAAPATAPTSVAATGIELRPWTGAAGRRDGSGPISIGEPLVPGARLMPCGGVGSRSIKLAGRAWMSDDVAGAPIGGGRGTTRRTTLAATAVGLLAKARSIAGSPRSRNHNNVCTGALGFAATAARNAGRSSASDARIAGDVAGLIAFSLSTSRSGSSGPTGAESLMLTRPW